jgi:hypothetical protein
MLLRSHPLTPLGFAESPSPARGEGNSHLSVPFVFPHWRAAV